MPNTAFNRRNRSLMTLPGWGRKVLPLAIIPVPLMLIRGVNRISEVRNEIIKTNNIDHYLTGNDVMDENPIPIFNVDESVMFLNKISQRVVVPVKYKRALSLQLGSSEHISVNCCVAADVHTLPPVIIFSNNSGRGLSGRRSGE